MFFSEKLIQYLGSPIIAFILLLFITQLVYMRFFSRLTPSLLSGGIVMALGAFALDSLRQLGFPRFMMLYIALEIFIIGAYLGITLVQAILEDEIQIKDPGDELAVATWVVGFAYTILLLNEVEKTLIGFIALLCIITFSLFVYYLWVLARWSYCYARKHTHMPVNPILLMATISVQAMVLLLSELFHDLVPDDIFVVIILCGIILYLLGLACIWIYLWHSRLRHLLASWNNENTINHGAFSMTGLAMMTTQAFPEYAIHAMWYLILIVFIVAESMALFRLFLRFKLKAPRRVIGVYHPSQWMRVFTFSVFYAFYLSYYEQEYAADPLTRFIVNYGQYLVAALLLAECVILIRFVLHKEHQK